MLDIGLKVKSGFSDAAVSKQLTYGTAVGLTKIAKEGQAAVQGKLKGTFTLRGKWYLQSNFFGIKIKPATPSNLASAVTTKADWIEKQAKGGDVLPFRNFLAVPTTAVRPKGSTKIIRTDQRPHALIASGKAFILTARKSGLKMIMMRKGRAKKKDLVVMYFLIKKIHLTAKDTFYDPVHAVVKRRLGTTLGESIQKALDGIREVA